MHDVTPEGLARRNISELELFAAALEITDTIERSRYLDRIGATDEALRRRLEALLRNFVEAGNFLETPAVPPLASTLPREQDSMRSLPPPPQRAARADEHRFVTRAEPGVAAALESLRSLLQNPSRPGGLGRLRHYEVLELLGHGGFGIVVRAVDDQLARTVAIKIMTPRLTVTWQSRLRFQREARAAAAIRHDNVVGIHAIEVEPIPFLVMEYVAGATLQQTVDRTGPLPPLDVLHIGVQIARGLAAAHAVGVIHRDIKPANILLQEIGVRSEELGVRSQQNTTATGASGPPLTSHSSLLTPHSFLVKITDFGLARAADDDSLTQSGVITGTPLYMAPEQAQGVPVDVRADLFSLGSVLYLMCSGRSPFRASTALAVLRRVSEDTPQPLREINPKVPGWLSDVIARLHQKCPADRFGSAQEVADLLERCLHEMQTHGTVQQSSIAAIGHAPAAARGAATGLSGPTAPLLARPHRRRQRAAAVLAVLAALALALVGMGLMLNDNKMLSDSGVGPQAAAKSPETAPAPDVAPDRRGAEYALSIGGTVGIVHSGKEWKLALVGELPESAFELTSVNLEGNTKVSDAGLAQFKDCTNLRVLRLHNARVSDAGLAHFKDCTRLGVLMLAGTRVGDAGLRYFKDCKKLIWLELDNTRISDVGLAAVKDYKELRHVALRQTYVSAVGIKDLRRALPLCWIEWSARSVEAPGDDFADRRAAMYVLAIGGTISIRHQGMDVDVDLSTAGKLPADAFALVSAHLASNAKLTDAGLVAFQECKNLLVLRLNDTAVSAAGLVHFKNNKRLWQLEVANTQASDAGLAAFADCKHIVSLNLSNNPKVTNAGLAHFRGCNLRVLALNNTQVNDAGLADFKVCQELFALQVQGTPVSDAGLKHFKDCRKLTELLLNDTQVSDAGLVHFKDRQTFTRLQLRGTRVTDVGLGYFKDCKNLSFLDLGKTQVGDAGLAHLQACKQLTHLQLNQTRVSDRGLAYLKDCKDLSVLVLNDSDVGDACLAHLKGCQSLTHLHLGHTRVTDAGLEQIAGFPRLIAVALENTKVSEAALHKLATALPKCKIHWNGGVLPATTGGHGGGE